MTELPKETCELADAVRPEAADTAVRAQVSAEAVGPDLRVSLAAGIFFFCLLAVTGLWPRAQADVAVLVMPFAARSHASEVVSAAGGQLVGGSRMPSVIIARAGAAPDSDGFAGRLYAAGALFVFDAGIIAGCAE